MPLLVRLQGLLQALIVIQQKRFKNGVIQRRASVDQDTKARGETGRA
jgi:hypothetical protein